MALPEPIEAGGGLAREPEERKEQRRNDRKTAREAKKRRKKLAAELTLKNRDPW